MMKQIIVILKILILVPLVQANERSFIYDIRKLSNPEAWNSLEADFQINLDNYKNYAKSNCKSKELSSRSYCDIDKALAIYKSSQIILDQSSSTQQHYVPKNNDFGNYKALNWYVSPFAKMEKHLLITESIVNVEFASHVLSLMLKDLKSDLDIIYKNNLMDYRRKIPYAIAYLSEFHPFMKMYAILSGMNCIEMEKECNEIKEKNLPSYQASIKAKSVYFKQLRDILTSSSQIGIPFPELDRMRQIYKLNTNLEEIRNLNFNDVRRVLNHEISLESMLPGLKRYRMEVQALTTLSVSFSDVDIDLYRYVILLNKLVLISKSLSSQKIDAIDCSQADEFNYECIHINNFYKFISSTDKMFQEFENGLK